MKNLNLLDCTLRDGGYYNNWDFSKEFVEDYLSSMSAAKIKFIELGFRFLKKDINLGSCAYTTSYFIDSLKIPKDLKIGVMINAKDLLSKKLNRNAINKIFFDLPRKNILSFFRFACQLSEIPNVIPYCNQLKKKGLSVAINLMQISEVSEIELKKISKLISKSKVDIFYFADSLGNLNPKNILNIVNIIKENCSKEIGFHSHDNMNRALINCETAFKNGVNWIDSTVTGMGRGPGNIQTELALLEFSKFLPKKNDISFLLDIIDKKFNPMKNKFNWGSNSYYYLAGQFSIHPTYIQSMLNDLKLSSNEILTAIENLKKKDGRIFNKAFIDTGEALYNKKTHGTWSPYKTIKGRDVLIIGSGPGSNKYSEDIKNFIKKTKPFVIALNDQKSIDENLINLRVCCNTLKILSDLNRYVKIEQPLAMPFESFTAVQKKKYKKTKVHNFGLEIKKDVFHFKERSSIIPNSLTFSYALSIANSGKAKTIFASGLDGYEVNDKRGIEMAETIKLYNKLKKRANLITITPSNYHINSATIHSFL